MILLHAMTAPRDLPGIGIERGATMYHLLSDTPGVAGTAELLAFARRCGGRDSWLQAPGTYREHFDIFGPWAARARDLGARLATNTDVARSLAAKRAAMPASGALPTLTSRQMRAVDELATGEYGIAVAQMLELAGARLAELTRRLLGDPRGRRIVVLVGPGHNGAGGLVAARHLANAGALTRVALLAPEERLSAVAAQRLATVRALGIAVTAGAPPNLADADLIVDALLGYSARGAPRDSIATAIRAANAAGRPILALDLPSGLAADDDGRERGALDDGVIRATTTMTVALPKRGLALAAAAPWIGELWLADIGLPRRIFKEVGAHIGPIFAASPLLLTRREPLAGDLLASPIDRLSVGETDPPAPLTTADPARYI